MMGDVTRGFNQKHYRLMMVMRKKTVERTRNSCFRGRTVHKAGNFCLWNTFGPMLDDPEIKDLVTAGVDEIIQEGRNKGTCWFTRQYSRFVGWSSTIDIDKLLSGIITECRELTERSTAQFIADPSYLAPPTKDFTIIFELKQKKLWLWVAVVHSVHPGRDVGRLEDDVSQRARVAFLDWNNPGQPINEQQNL